MGNQAKCNPTYDTEAPTYFQGLNLTYYKSILTGYDNKTFENVAVKTFHVALMARKHTFL